MISIASRTGVIAALGVSALGCGERSIYIGVCNGWQAPATYFAGDITRSMDLADVNGDGKPDIVLTGLGGPSMLLNRGDGTFDEVVFLALSEDLPNDVEVADLDGDGDGDIVFTEWLAEGTASVLWNDGEATFTAGPDIVVHPDPNGFPGSIQASDLNGDGEVDLAVTVLDIEPAAVSVLFNQGGGTFAAPVVYPAGGAKPRRLLAADLSGDGKPDLAFIDYDTADELHVMLQQAGGTFAEAGTYAAGTDPRDVAAADLDGDGNLDLVVGTWDDLDGIRVFLGEGGGTFAPPLSFATRLGVRAVAPVDMDHDGTLDLALVRGSDGRNLALLRGLGDGLFGHPEYADVTELEQAVAASDLNGDGAPDLVLASMYGTLTVLLGCPE